MTTDLFLSALVLSHSALSMTTLRRGWITRFSHVVWWVDIKSLPTGQVNESRLFMFPITHSCRVIFYLCYAESSFRVILAFIWLVVSIFFHRRRLVDSFPCFTHLTAPFTDSSLHLTYFLSIFPLLLLSAYSSKISLSIKDAVFSPFSLFILHSSVFTSVFTSPFDFTLRFSTFVPIYTSIYLLSRWILSNRFIVICLLLLFYR